MNTNRGFFDRFTKPAPDTQPSPFTVAEEAAASGTTPSPFVAASPFQIADDPAVAFGKPVKIPERRSVESPFQIAEPPEGFGFEAPVKPAPQASGGVPAAEFPPHSAPAQFTASPFGQKPESPFRPLQEPAAATPVSRVQSASSGGDLLFDSSSIRQLELRAIFGVDHELSAEEIVQRGRALPGVRHLSRVAAREVAAFEELKKLLTSLGLPGPLKINVGNAPVHFVRENGVLLAVLTEGGFAPGVRETLMLIARELGRLD
jgi:hypothetical protein